MIYGADDKLTEVKKGTNGFACIPTVMNLPIPDPMCMDAASNQWMTDIMSEPQTIQYRSWHCLYGTRGIPL